MLNEDFNIDDLKKSWQEQQVPEVYESSEIQAMLNKTSKNYVKYIFWISLAEFLLFAGVAIFTVFSSQKTNSFMNMLEKLGVKLDMNIETHFAQLYIVLKVFSLVITAVFVYLFYKNYRKINVENNLKNFILQIIKFKKTVNAYILVNIILLIVFMAVLTLFTMNILQNQNIHLNNPTLLGFIAGVIIGLGFGIFLILIYYRLVYGIIMRRLGKNLEQLQKIEKES